MSERTTDHGSPTASDWLVSHTGGGYYVAEGRTVWWTHGLEDAATFDEDRAKALARDLEERLPDKDIAPFGTYISAVPKNPPAGTGVRIIRLGCSFTWGPEKGWTKDAGASLSKLDSIQTAAQKLVEEHPGLRVTSSHGGRVGSGNRVAGWSG
ncbi:MAG TPA: hypothetical protein VGV69_08405, partial [Solirubrobacterales bacterium]|nr:hypothetical protein [Solirubrobacterales bacterium]